MTVVLPFLTETDPPSTGEGVLDPLGLATIGERLAELLLPGLRARMSHPRFLTAMAVAAAVCEGITDEYASDQVTPAHIVFEWLLVEGLIRHSNEKLSAGTAGRNKVRDALRSGTPLDATSYLKAPGVFGFHGIYKPLAWKLGILEKGDFRLGEAGYELLSVWEKERGLAGFKDSGGTPTSGSQLRSQLRSAVEDTLRKGCVARSGGWAGWNSLAEHLTPQGMEEQETTCLYGQLCNDPAAGARREVFELLRATDVEGMTEMDIATTYLLPRAGGNLHERLMAIYAYEKAVAQLETAFEWLRFISTTAGARAIGVGDLAERPEVRRAGAAVRETFLQATEALRVASIETQNELNVLDETVNGVTDVESLYGAVLARHAKVQKEKPPAGKRDWFEHSSSGGVFVRVPYRSTNAPIEGDSWHRPYRLYTVASFLADFGRGAS